MQVNGGCRCGLQDPGRFQIDARLDNRASNGYSVRNRATVFDSFQTVNSVGSTRIAERAATSLGEVLETETGVAKRSFGPGSSRPVIRGFDGDRVLVLQDGVRSGSVGSQSGDHGETVDPLSAERIEVVKGPGTLLYGSNALGGVVNVIGHHEDEAHDGVRGFTGVAGSADKQAGGRRCRIRCEELALSREPECPADRRSSNPDRPHP